MGVNKYIIILNITGYTDYKLSKIIINLNEIEIRNTYFSIKDFPKCGII